MTVFGRTLGGEEIASLVFLSMALVIWVMAWRGERNWARWFRGWEAGRKAERAADQGGDQPPPPASGAPRGPWG